LTPTKPFVPSLSNHEWPAMALRQAQGERFLSEGEKGESSSLCTMMMVSQKVSLSCHPEQSEGPVAFLIRRDSSLRPAHHSVQGFAQNDKGPFLARVSMMDMA
jgi:hypothetical protein